MNASAIFAANIKITQDWWDEYGADSIRRTWSQVTSPQQGIIVFRDDNDQVETYRLNDIGMLQRL